MHYLLPIKRLVAWLIQAIVSRILVIVNHICGIFCYVLNNKLTRLCSVPKVRRSLLQRTFSILCTFFWPQYHYTYCCHIFHILFFHANKEATYDVIYAAFQNSVDIDQAMSLSCKLCSILVMLPGNSLTH